MATFLRSLGFQKLFLLQLAFICLALPFLSLVEASNFNHYFYVTWANDHVKLLNHGKTVQLTLDQASGSGFASKNEYLFGSVSMNIKLVPGNSAGTVTTIYMSSDTSKHDEIDFEFLGNLPGQNYSLQTNIYANGVGNREQRINLWFDPSADFHNYSILWNHKLILMSVDSIPIRVFKDKEALGVPYLKDQPMKIYASIWNGDKWATEGGRVKINWSYAPFVATYQSFAVDACIANGPVTPRCARPRARNWWDLRQFQRLSRKQRRMLRRVRRNHMVYDYCKDRGRFRILPPECLSHP